MRLSSVLFVFGQVLGISLLILATLYVYAFEQYGTDVAVQSSDGNWADSELQFKGRDFEALVYLFEGYKFKCNKPEAKLQRTTMKPPFPSLRWVFDDYTDPKWQVPFAEPHPSLGGSTYYPPATADNCATRGWTPDESRIAKERAEKYLRDLAAHNNTLQLTLGAVGTAAAGSVPSSPSGPELRRYVSLWRVLMAVSIVHASMLSSAEETAGIEAPACVGRQVMNELSALCVARFFVRLTSDLFIGWPSAATRSGDTWIVYSDSEKRDVVGFVDVETGDWRREVPKHNNTLQPTIAPVESLACAKATPAAIAAELNRYAAPTTLS